LADGLKTALSLLKIVLPVFAVIKVLEHTPVIVWISKIFDHIRSIDAFCGTSRRSGPGGGNGHAV